MHNTERSKLIISERFPFEYVAYGARLRYPKRHPRAEKRRCKVEIYKKHGKAEVFITEADRNLPWAEVKENFGDTAFQLRQAGHFKIPQWIYEDDVKWYRRVLLDEKGRDVFYRAFICRSDWRIRFYVKMKRECVMGDYRVRNVGFIADHHLIIRTGGFFKNRPWMLPLAMYPSLLEATDSARKNFRLSRNRTVIYWPELQIRLFGRDAILFGEELEKKPEGISDFQFLEQPVNPRLI